MMIMNSSTILSFDIALSNHVNCLEICEIYWFLGFDLKLKHCCHLFIFSTLNLHILEVAKMLVSNIFRSKHKTATLFPCF